MDFPDIETQMQKIMRGVEEIIHEHEMRQRIQRGLETGKPLRVKLGVDPTASDIHLGHMVTIRKLKHFQDLGHIAIFLIGDFTARIGDPTERSEARVRLTKEQVWEHAASFKSQVFRILDEQDTELRSNGEWFDKMTFADCLDLAYRSTVARMLERNDFETRYREGNPITITEFLYPLMQGYDSVALQCDVELGGTDQKFNLLAGRDIQIQHGQEPQVVIMTPLIEGLDGSKKMSKTERNYIAVDDTPEDMFGKTMSIKDDLMVKYFTLLTDVDQATVKQYEQALREVEKHQNPDDPLHPMKIKKELGRGIVIEYHGEKAARTAEEYFERVVQRKEIPDEIPLISLPNRVVQAYEIVALGASVSKTEARRLVDQGAVKVDGERLSDPAQEMRLSLVEMRFQVGKRKFFRVRLEDA
ncbi:MAG: tyrosine--tRNA ligase [Deltaproteobacteria bacterium]|nr:tyrosine--tRNA ligase [Deltaproteobacteria bacterium]